MSSPVRYGIVGCSGIGTTHAAALDDIEDADLVACADIDEDAAAAFADEYEVAESYTDTGRMIETADIDAVSVCTPSGTHADVAIEAAHAGADILCEKPLDVYADRINAMIAAADEAGVTLAGVFQRRFDPQLRRAKQLVDEGEIGDVILSDTRVKWFRSQEYYDSGGWRGTRDMDGGCMMNQGVHDIDALQWLVGDVEAVSAMTGTLARELDCEDTAAVAVQFASGALGSIEVTTAVKGGVDGVEVNGTDGSFSVVDGELTDVQIGTGEESHYHADTEETDPEDAPHPCGVGHPAVLADFVESVRTGREPEVPAQEARKAVDVILASYRSAEEGRVVRLDELRDS